jgi:hypothetical protein
MDPWLRKYGYTDSNGAPRLQALRGGGYPAEKAAANPFLSATKPLLTGHTHSNGGAPRLKALRGGGAFAEKRASGSGGAPPRLQALRGGAYFASRAPLADSGVRWLEDEHAPTACGEEEGGGGGSRSGGGRVRVMGAHLSQLRLNIENRSALYSGAIKALLRRY